MSKNKENKKVLDSFPGDVIGLPIDRQNCEATTSAGVATPVGTLNPRKLIETSIKCVKCGSDLINIHNNGETFYCCDCGYEWSVHDVDNDGIDDDSESSNDISINTVSKDTNKDTNKDTKQEASKNNTKSDSKSFRDYMSNRK